MNWTTLLLAWIPVFLNMPVLWPWLAKYSRRKQNEWLNHWQVVDDVNRWYETKTERRLLPSNLFFVILASVSSQLLWLATDIAAIYGIWLWIDGSPNWWFSIAWFWSVRSRISGMALVHAWIQKSIEDNGPPSKPIVVIYAFQAFILFIQPLLGIPSMIMRLLVFPIERISESKRIHTIWAWGAWMLLLAATGVGSQIATKG